MSLCLKNLVRGSFLYLLVQYFRFLQSSFCPRINRRLHLGISRVASDQLLCRDWYLCCNFHLALWPLCFALHPGLHCCLSRVSLHLPGGTGPFSGTVTLGGHHLYHFLRTVTEVSPWAHHRCTEPCRGRAKRP